MERGLPFFDRPVTLDCDWSLTNSEPFKARAAGNIQTLCLHFFSVCGQGILIDLEVKERFLSTLKLTKSGVNKKSKKHFREAKCSALQS